MDLVRESGKVAIDSLDYRMYTPIVFYALSYTKDKKRLREILADFVPSVFSQLDVSKRKEKISNLVDFINQNVPISGIPISYNFVNSKEYDDISYEKESLPILTRSKYTLYFNENILDFDDEFYETSKVPVGLIISFFSYSLLSKLIKEIETILQEKLKEQLRNNSPINKDMFSLACALFVDDIAGQFKEVGISYIGITMYNYDICQVYNQNMQFTQSLSAILITRACKWIVDFVADAFKEEAIYRTFVEKFKKIELSNLFQNINMGAHVTSTLLQEKLKVLLGFSVIESREGRTDDKYLAITPYEDIINACKSFINAYIQYENDVLSILKSNKTIELMPRPLFNRPNKIQSMLDTRDKIKAQEQQDAMNNNAEEHEKDVNKHKYHLYTKKVLVRRKTNSYDDN